MSFYRCSCSSDKDMSTSGCVVFNFFREKKQKSFPASTFKHNEVPVKSNVKTCILPFGTASCALRQQRAMLAGTEEQIDWCIGELKLPRLVISPASVWKLCEHRDTSHRWLTVPGCSHITAACQTTQLSPLWYALVCFSAVIAFAVCWS